MTLDDFMKFYNDFYMPAYSDLVGYLGDKPAQVIVEVENIAVHLIRVIDPKCSGKQQEENLQKAYNHLVRVTIDCLKILWVELGKDIGKMHTTASLIKKGLLVDEDVFLAAHLAFKDLSCKARRLEMDNVGTDPLKCLDLYGELVNLGWSIVRLRDDEKMKKVLLDLFPEDEIPSPV